jgi:hypothetical protein
MMGRMRTYSLAVVVVCAISLASAAGASAKTLTLITKAGVVKAESFVRLRAAAPLSFATEYGKVECGEEPYIYGLLNENGTSKPLSVAGRGELDPGSYEGCSGPDQLGGVETHHYGELFFPYREVLPFELTSAGKFAIKSTTKGTKISLTTEGAYDESAYCRYTASKVSGTYNIGGPIVVKTGKTVFKAVKGEPGPCASSLTLEPETWVVEAANFSEVDGWVYEPAEAQL